MIVAQAFWLKLEFQHKHSRTRSPALLISSQSRPVYHCLADMEALKYLMSPVRQKVKIDDGEGTIPDLDDEDMYVDSVNSDELDDEQPAWARRQEERMIDHFNKMISTNVQEIRNEVAQMKVQVDYAITTADAALGKARELSTKLDALDQPGVTIEVLNQKIEEAMTNVQRLIEAAQALPRNVNVGAQMPKGSDDEKLARTMVVGGFMQDSERNDVIDLIGKHIISDKEATVDEVYAYNFGSIGFVRFTTAGHMKEFLTKFGAKPRPEVNGKSLWASVSRSPEERKKAKHISKYKRVMIEVGLLKADDIKIDYRRGVLIAKRQRIAEWQGEGSDGHVQLNEENMKKIGIDVGANALHNAVKELLSQ